VKTRWFALVSETAEVPRSRHFLGLPPELVGNKDNRVALPRSRILVLSEDSDSGVLLYRYAHDGRFSGDTWHPSIEDAKHQAEFEFGDALGKWNEVPQEVVDVLAFALSKQA
jgi:hypothetical protein